MLHLQQQMTCLDWIIDSAGPGVSESKNLANSGKQNLPRASYNLKMKGYYLFSAIVQVLK